MCYELGSREECERTDVSHPQSAYPSLCICTGSLGRAASPCERDEFDADHSTAHFLRR